MFQDGASNVKLLIKRADNQGKRVRCFDIRLFYFKDLIVNEEVKVVHCSTESMSIDHDSKLLVGGKFNFLRGAILSFKQDSSLPAWTEGVHSKNAQADTSDTMIERAENCTCVTLVLLFESRFLECMSCNAC